MASPLTNVTRRFFGDQIQTLRGLLTRISFTHVTLAAAATCACVAGLAVSIDLRVAAAAVAVLAALATIHTRAWLPIVGLILVGLVLLSYGFNNVPVPLGGVAVPLVDVALVYVVVASYSLWWPAISTTSLGRTIFVLLCAITVIAVLRLILDIPRFGAVAGRDALYVLEAWAVLAGIATGHALGPDRLYRLLGILWRCAIIFFLLYPLRETLSAIGPEVGIQRPTPLISFTNADFIAAGAVFWFLQENRRSSLLFACLSLLVLLMTQVRGQILAVALTLLVGWSWLSLRRGHTPPMASRVPRRIAVAGALALLALAILPSFSGRLGEPVSGEVLLAQLSTLAGAEGPGAGSLEHRTEAWPQVLDTVQSSSAGWLVGVGYGPDLFGGFQTEEGRDVRKPHNDALEIWARTGLMGFLPWLALVASLGVWAFRTAPTHPFGWWLIALQFATLITALTQPAFGFAYRGMVYMLLVGMVVGCSSLDRGARSAAASTGL